LDKLIAAMKVTLGTTFTLYVKAHACHWNVEGPTFVSYHRLFGDIYSEIWQAIDDIAEQIRQLDAYAPASLERFMELSRIKGTNEVLPPHDMLVMLMKDTEMMITVLTETLHLAEAEDRQGLVNFLAGRLEAHTKQRWMLRASAKKL
jgi:starvation-inducible DNA-binding protein